jgi:hypothetical protein
MIHGPYVYENNWLTHIPKSSTSILTPFVVSIVLLRSVFLLCVVIYNYSGYIWNRKERCAGHILARIPKSHDKKISSMLPITDPFHLL